MKQRIRRSLAILLTMLALLGAAQTASAEGGHADEAGAKAAILRALRAMETETDITAYGIPRERVADLYREVLAENPSIFYADGGVGWSYYSNTGCAAVLEIRYLDGVGAAEVAAYEVAAAEALRCVQPWMNAVQIALVLHDHLALRTAYDQQGYESGSIDPMSYSAYGALVLGKAVCSGYARAYQDLLARCGIPCEVVDSDSLDHAWNLVQLGPNWYHVDVTWDDPVPDRPGRVHHTFFLLSDGAMESTTSGSGKRHYGWSSQRSCTDAGCDTGMPWAGQESAICITDADSIWLLKTENSYQEQTTSLVRRSWSTGAAEVMFCFQDYWPVWNENRFWLGSFSSLVQKGDCLYLNDPLRVYCFHTAAGQCEEVFRIDGTEGRLYGLYREGDAICCLVATGPREAGTVITLSEASASPFADVPVDADYLSAVRWALEAGVTTGTGQDALGRSLFSPDSTCTRAEVVTFLWRSMGSPVPEREGNPFVDTAPGAWYLQSMLWAVEQGITAGTGYDAVLGGDTFSPEASCSYAQILTFLWRCRTGERSSQGIWYEAALRWAAESGVSAGTGLAVGGPEAACPRKDVASFLWRCAA